jgi:glutaredoxin
MKYIIYSKENCMYCLGAKKLAHEELLKYEVIDIGTGIAVEDFKAKFPEQKTAPLIMAEDDAGNVTKVGGYKEFYDRIMSMKKNVEINI